jgi:hypothetical protein
VSERYTDRLERELEVATKWAGAWKGFARRVRAMLVKEMVEMHQTHMQLQGIMANARNNPGLLLASLVLEAAKDGVELGSRASECMGWAFAHYLSNHPEAPNYLEVTLAGGDHKPIYVTVQRPDGKTPHQMRMEAEGKLEALKKALSIDKCDLIFCPDPACPQNNPRT